MRLTIYAPLLSAAVLAASASLPADRNRHVRQVSHVAEGDRFQPITWEEAVQIMRGKDDEADDSNGNNSSATLNHANQTTGAQAAASWRCENPKVRVEWSRMAEDDKQWYLESIKCLMETPPLGVWSEAESLWDEIAWVHNRLIPSIHDVDAFLPWHRYYLHLQSSLLEEHCSYTGPIPWWRESSYTGDFASSELFTPEYFGSLPPAPRIGDGTCITDGVSALFLQFLFLCLSTSTWYSS